MSKLKQKKGKKSKVKKQVDYPDGKNPFENENGGLAKEQKSKHKKEKKKKGKKIKLLKGKRKRALTNAISDLNNQNQVPEVTKSTTTEKQESSDHKERLSNAPNSIPSYLRNSNQIINTKTEARCRKKPSEGDIKSLHKNSQAQSYGKNNPFKADIIEEGQRVQKPSKDGIKSLHKNSQAPSYGKNNPFAVDIAEETKILSLNSPENEVKQQEEITATKKETHHHAIRRHRGASIVISSRERSKKKRKRIIKAFKKKKKEQKNNLKSDKDDRTYNPKPKQPQQSNAHIGEMRQHVEETKEVVKNNLEKLANRQSNLTSLYDSVETLEAKAEQFKEITRDIAVKKEAETKCCGLFSKYRCCQYLCTCRLPPCLRRRGKRKSAKDAKNKKNKARAGLSDDDDAYELAETSLLHPDAESIGSRRTANYANESPSSKRKSGLLQPKSEKTDSKLSLRATVQNSRFLQSLDQTRLRRRKSGRTRATSSMGDLADLISESEHAKLMDKEVRRSIHQSVMQYEDEETKRRAAELRMLDYS